MKIKHDLLRNSRFNVELQEHKHLLEDNEFGFGFEHTDFEDVNVDYFSLKIDLDYREFARRLW